MAVNFENIRTNLFTAVIGDVLDQRGYRHQFLDPGIAPLVPGTRLVGRAMTVLETPCVEGPGRGPLSDRPFGLMFEALDDLKPDEIYLTDGTALNCALWGGLMSTRAMHLNAAGAILNGYVRDTPGIRRLGFPVFSRGAFAQELFTVREMFEKTCFPQFLQGDPDRHIEATKLRAEHEAIADNINDDFMLFPRLDEKFHRIWIDGSGNRFVQHFFELISLVFQYHYRWNKQDELERNDYAVGQHLEIISALDNSDTDRAMAAFLTHLEHAKETLLASVVWDGTT